MELDPIINGWDIGGVNIKAVQIDNRTTPSTLIKSTSIPFEIWHNPDEYTCPTPDNRRKTVNDARDRLARLACADSEFLLANEIDNIAMHLRKKQIEQISTIITQVLSRLNDLSGVPAVVTGTGAFLAKKAAKKAGIPDIIHWKSEKDGNCLPAFAAASLLITNKRVFKVTETIKNKRKAVLLKRILLISGL